MLNQGKGRNQEDTSVYSETTSRNKPRKKAKKWPFVIGITLMVVAVAGGAFFVWHEQPSFCNALCHTPMDNYVEGYYNDSSLLAHEHQRSGVTCLHCHDAKIDEQITEGVRWVQGDYALDEKGNLATVGVTADKKLCASEEACHSYSEVVASTQSWGGVEGVNPHLSHQGEEIDCSNCHTVHSKSYMFCNTCHEWEVPEGWEAPR